MATHVCSRGAQEAGVGIAFKALPSSGRPHLPKDLQISQKAPPAPGEDFNIQACGRQFIFKPQQPLPSRSSRAKTWTGEPAGRAWLLSMASVFQKRALGLHEVHYYPVVQSNLQGQAHSPRRRVLQNCRTPWGLGQIINWAVNASYLSQCKAENVSTSTQQELLEG